MIDDREKATQSWAKFLNPDVLRGNLIAASIFIAAYEMLRASVIDQIRSFFSHEFKDCVWIPSPDYEKNCLALDKSPFRASLVWLKQMGAVDEADISRIDLIRQHRNELAHDLPKFLATVDDEVNVQLLVGIYELITKVDRWWIREVEMTIDPDFDGREIADEDITSGRMLFIQMMLRIATGEDSETLWKEFQKQVATASPGA